MGAKQKQNGNKMSKMGVIWGRKIKRVYTVRRGGTVFEAEQKNYFLLSTKNIVRYKF